MWTRMQLKQNAKSVLARTFWMAVAVCLIAGLMGAGSESGITGGSRGIQAAAGLNAGGQYEQMLPYSRPGSGYSEMPVYPGGPVIQFNFFGHHFAFRLPSAGRTIFFVVAGMAGLLGLAWRVFLGGPAEVGRASFFLHSRYQEGKISLFFRAFSKDSYKNAVSTIFLRDLYVFLWSLLFVIPGIIKTYSYRMVPYLLAENPSMSTSRAIELSCQMTKGEKWNIFVLDLSFIGWAILAAIPCGLGYLALNPYMQATEAELFAALRVKALSEGYTTIEEIGRP